MKATVVPREARQQQTACVRRRCRAVGSAPLRRPHGTAMESETGIFVLSRLDMRETAIALPEGSGKAVAPDYAFPAEFIGLSLLAFVPGLQNAHREAG